MDSLTSDTGVRFDCKGIIIAAVTIAVCAGAGRRWLVRLALKRAWKGDPLSLLVLKHLGGKRPRLDAFEDGLPSLPVPPLGQTLARWLESLEPLLDADQMAQVRADAAELESSAGGRELQALLERRAATSRNWLSEWWEEFAYLRGRLPLPTYANFFCTDSGCNLHEPSHEPDQARRVSALISAAMDFKHRVDTNSLQPLRIRGVLPVCMAGMRRIFGTTRVPGPEADTLQTHSIPAQQADAHVLLNIGASLFCLPVLVQGLRVPTETLERALRAAMAEADAQGSSCWGAGRDAQPCVSLLTAVDRGTWAACRGDIVASSEQNAAAMSAVEQALFAVSLLDRPAPSAKTPSDQGYIITKDWVRRVVQGEESWHAGGELAASQIDMRAYAKEVLHGDGRGVWYDKSVTIVAFSDGRVGFHYEHTYADAPVPGLMCEHAYINTNPRAAAARIYPPLSLPSLPSSTVVRARRLEWETRRLPSLQQWLASAEVATAALLAQVDIQPVHWLAFGADALKRLQISPDAFCQAVLQVVAKRWFGRPVLTYESASLRSFHRGRTECIRSASPAMTSFARAFVAFSDGNDRHETPGKHKVGELLRAAGAEHSALGTSVWVCGCGVGGRLRACVLVGGCV